MKPRHIGIIPDGNRRWAKKNGMDKKDGYSYGLEPGMKVFREAVKAGIEEITFYGFTVDNCKRPKEQFNEFSNACVKAVEMIASEGAELLVIGNSESECFPKELKKYTVRTKVGNGGIRLNFLVNYGWKWDLSQMPNLKSSDISRIDLIIRWGGMKRLSGFLPVQSVYSDIYTVDSLWPEYDNSQFYDALKWYTKQDVTLGG